MTAFHSGAGALMQATSGSGEPPIVGIGAQVTFFAFLVVVLVVPFVMAWEPADRTSLAREQHDDPQSFFSSRRERRLWMWAVVTLLAIYLTLTPVAELAAWLRERNLLQLSSTVFLVLVAVAIAVAWLKTRPGRLEVGAGLGVAAVYLTTVIRLPVLEARSHLFEYGLIALLIYHALRERRRNGRSVPNPAFAAVLATALLGWFDEGIQAFIPSRVYDLFDVGFNALAGLMAVTASLVIGWARGWDVFNRDRKGT